MPQVPHTASPPPLRNVVAMLHVTSVPRSAAFYALLGFEVANTHYELGCEDEPLWAWLQSRHGASLMLAKADEPVDPAAQAVLFYLYCDDVTAMHATLHASAMKVGDITYPFYCPRGEFRTIDPDGYVAMITHT